MSSADDWREAMLALLSELLDGPPGREAYVLNPGDPGLFRSLGAIDAAAASVRAHGGGASIAAHVDHLRYGFSLMNRWIAGEPDPFATADFAASWDRTTVTDAEWEARRAALEAEARRWAHAVRASGGRAVSDIERRGLLSSVAHLAYHLGAIRQIDRAAAGPPARD